MKPGELTPERLDWLEAQARHTVAADTFWLALRGAQSATDQLPLIGGDV